MSKEKWTYVYGNEGFDNPVLISPCGTYLLTGVYNSTKDGVYRGWKLEVLNKGKEVT